MSSSENYYRRRIEEELAAAKGSADPSSCRIHLEMARRYRDILSCEVDRAKADTAPVEAGGGAIAESGAVLV